jgi:hypothetical protein
MKKREVLLLFLVFALALSVSGCFKRTVVVSCSSPDVIIGERCCRDNNANSICDDEDLKGNTSTADVCGNNVCENGTGENCTTCWKDCGACKTIVYIYVPRNFTLAEITQDLDAMTRESVKFRKDINALNNVSNFFYFGRPVTRHVAEFMSVPYDLLKDSRKILLSHILLESYYVNGSDSLFSYVNSSHWYLTHTIISSDRSEYEQRIASGKATKDYPTQPTGYQKELRYDDWEYKNFTKKEQGIYNNITTLGEEGVEAVYASITNYSIAYKYHYYDNKEFGLKEAFRYQEEKYLSYVHSLSFVCARNLVITLYSYDYNPIEYTGMNQGIIQEQVVYNRAGLRDRADAIKRTCDRKYSNKIFTYS